MEVTFLGTGNARGIPAFGCDCDICERAKADPTYVRHCPSHLIKAGHEILVLDAGRFDLHRIAETEPFDSILLSHFHPDHVYGLFMVGWGRKRKIHVFAPPDRNGYADLVEDPGILSFEFVKPFESFQIGSFRITPFPLRHSILTFGYAIERESAKIAYFMDTCGLPEDTAQFVSGWRPDLAIIDCNQTPDNPKPSHNTPGQAFEIHRIAESKRSYLSHISCHVEAWLESTAILPPDILAAYDGLTVDVYSDVDEVRNT